MPWPNSGALTTAGDYVWVRFVYDATAERGHDLDVDERDDVRVVRRADQVTQYLGQPGGLRVGLFAKHDGCGQRHGRQSTRSTSSSAPPTRRRAGDDCGGDRRLCPQIDEFDGTALDPKWEIATRRRPTWPSRGGKLALTSAQGDVSGANFTARNILLQDVPQGPWTVTDEARPHGDRPERRRPRAWWSTAPAARTTSPRSAIQYKTNDLSGQPMNGIWAERVLTVNGTITRHVGRPVPEHRQAHRRPTSDLWLRASYDGTNLISEYSYDGTTFTTIAPPVPVATAFGTAGITKIGLFVKHDSGNTARPIKFDSFTVDAASCGSGRRHDAAEDHPHARSGLAGRRRVASTSPTSRSRSPRPTTTAARAWTTPSTASGRRDVDRVQRPVRRHHRGHARRSSTARSTRSGNIEATESVDVQDRQGRPDDHRQAQRRGAEGQLRRSRRG